MFQFLIDIYETDNKIIDKDGKLGEILGNLRISPETNLPFELNRMEDWSDSLLVSLGEGIKFFSMDQAYDIMVVFLEKIKNEIESNDASELYQFVNNKENTIIKNKWNDIIRLTLQMYR